MSEQELSLKSKAGAKIHPELPDAPRSVALCSQPHEGFGIPVTPLGCSLDGRINGEWVFGKKEDGSYRLLKDLDGTLAQTVSVPLVGTVACGLPILAEENVQALIRVSVDLAQPGGRYFLLRAVGDSMDLAGIEDGDLILVKHQPVANDGQRVVAVIDDEVTVKEYHRKGNVVMLLPKSRNVKHQPIIMTRDFRIQGVVIDTIPKY